MVDGENICVKDNSAECPVNRENMKVLKKGDEKMAEPASVTGIYSKTSKFKGKKYKRKGRE